MPGGSGVVGAACSNNDQCSSRCVTEGFPGGMCTVECGSDAACPGGTACIDEKGGICEVLCSSNADCAGFGGGWVCEHRDRRGGPGSEAVCHGA